ncbi:MAG: thioesterase family protein [Acidimicrobiales bacterium]|nr:thioesterase family protein [Acidimicrobiia bacterium]NNC81279.1 thioesterase family protein [Acidimicrobiales bacterium]
MENAALFEATRPDLFEPSEFTRGPWRPDAQHGGPPSALLGHATLRVVEEDEHVAHIEVELVRPVPLATIRTATRRENVSGRVHRVLAELWAADELVARSNALVLRTSDLIEPEWVAPERQAPGIPSDDAVADPPRWASGDLTTYHRNAMEHRFTAGTFREPGPAVDWQRLRMPVIAGRNSAGLERVLASADFGSGISAIYSATSTHGLINANLSVSLLRYPEGEWISIDATTTASSSGTGLCVTRLGDLGGEVGVATQSLLAYRVRGR